MVPAQSNTKQGSGTGDDEMKNLVVFGVLPLPRHLHDVCIVSFLFDARPGLYAFRHGLLTKGHISTEQIPFCPTFTQKVF